MARGGVHGSRAAPRRRAASNASPTGRRNFGTDFGVAREVCATASARSGTADKSMSVRRAPPWTGLAEPGMAPVAGSRRGSGTMRLAGNARR